MYEGAELLHTGRLRIDCGPDEGPDETAHSKQAT